MKKWLKVLVFVIVAIAVLWTVGYYIYDVVMQFKGLHNAHLILISSEELTRAAAEVTYRTTLLGLIRTLTLSLIYNAVQVFGYIATYLLICAVFKNPEISIVTKFKEAFADTFKK